ncbi:YtpR family tRNA-binding protein [Streptococcus entericus]|uniref:YtpR family tRNA-binding protein n=1 Tax=Streptococcus entericus TaxID=155680 RepID=UPI00035E9B11|nr:DUF4479 and tRNA-binding domain-containing protein [Streptococcus entericus]
MIFIYNKHVGDVLMVIVADDQKQAVEVDKRETVARIVRKADGQTVAWNIFQVSELFPIEGNGQVFLSAEELQTLNQRLTELGFDEELVADDQPKFVVGEIVELTAHPDSDHLNICQVKVSADETVQIVAGAPNVALGLKTIVALPGAMMPSGLLIFPGQLRGVDSYGMMCSPRELALPNAPQKRGIIELAADTPVGQAFSPDKHWQL